MNLKSTILLFCFVLTACGYLNSGNGRSTDALNQSSDVLVRLSNMPACDGQHSYEGCELVNVTTSKDDFDWKYKQTVLLIDSADSSSMTRYKNRIRMRLKTDETGNYVEESISYKLPKFLVHTFETLGKSFTPSSDYSKYNDTFNDKFPNVWFEFPVDHGNSILDILAEYNPESAFVLARYIQPPAELLCNRNWDGLKNYYSNGAESLKNTINNLNIAYINLSAGETRATAREHWGNLCKGGSMNYQDEANFLESVNEYFQKLANIDGVILAQAGASGNVNKDSAPIDCNAEDYKNRIRIGAFSNIDLEVGSGLALNKGKKYLKSLEYSAENCLDIWINSGISPNFPFKAGPNPVEVLSGIGMVSIPYWATSYATPVALSKIINLKEVYYPNHGLTNKVIEKIFRMIGKKVLIDPVKQKSLEVYRLNYKK